MPQEDIFGDEPGNPPLEPTAACPDELAVLPSPGPVPTTPAAETPASLAAEVVHPTSTSDSKQWKLLDRVAKGPRAQQFPGITELWKGDSASKQRALKMYLQSNENLDAVESNLKVEKSHAESITHRRGWLTITQMQEKGFSKNLVCINHGNRCHQIVCC